MSQRKWEQTNRPSWIRAQSTRLDKGHFAQERSHEPWKKMEEQRQWWQQWQDSWEWDWAKNWWASSDWSSRGWSWKGSQGWHEPTVQPPCRSKQASSGWDEDKYPGTLTLKTVHEDTGRQCLNTLTLLSFQPHRHITMVLGRPIIVHMWSKNLRAIL